MNYNEQEHREQMYSNDIYKRLFVVPLGEDVGNYFLLNLARALGGDNMKRFFFWIRFW